MTGQPLSQALDPITVEVIGAALSSICLLYTSDAADE